MTSRLFTSEEQQPVMKAIRDGIDQVKKERSLSIDNGTNGNSSSKPASQIADQTQELPSSAPEIKRQTSNMDENDKVSIYVMCNVLLR